jgi:hypothetical protein
VTSFGLTIKACAGKTSTARLAFGSGSDIPSMGSTWARGGLNHADVSDVDRPA